MAECVTCRSCSHDACMHAVQCLFRCAGASPCNSSRLLAHTGARNTACVCERGFERAFSRRWRRPAAMDFAQRMYRIRKTCLEMLHDRGYLITDVRREEGNAAQPARALRR